MEEDVWNTLSQPAKITAFESRESAWDYGMVATEHNMYSSYREMLLEHLFAGAVMRYLWLAGFTRLEMLKSQVDDSGYDLILEANSIVRHIQLKASHRGFATSRANVNDVLAKKSRGFNGIASILVLTGKHYLLDTCCLSGSTEVLAHPCVA
ncbi:MAG: hypothetical protein M3440_12190, partial [Chloroflexota bacterium]|nr:hypothetical protein [Chloroflexota bacterium]